MKIIDLAMDFNFSAMPDSRTAEKRSENANALYNYCAKHVDELLAIGNNDGFHTGMAFVNIVTSMKEPNRNDRHSADNQKFKFSLYCAVFCLWKGTQMGTMQSCSAANTLIHTIDYYKEQYFVPIFLNLTGYTLEEIFEHDPEDLKKKVDAIYKHIKYYLIQITRAQDAFKDANIEACNKGKKYLDAMCEEIESAFQGYQLLGII